MMIYFTQGDNLVSVDTDEIIKIVFDYATNSMTIYRFISEKDITLTYKSEDFDGVIDSLLSFTNEYENDFLYVEADERIEVLRKEMIESIDVNKDLIIFKMKNKAYTGTVKVSGKVSRGISEIYIAQAYAIELIEEMNQSRIF